MVVLNIQHKVNKSYTWQDLKDYKHDIINTINYVQYNTEITWIQSGLDQP